MIFELKPTERKVYVFNSLNIGDIVLSTRTSKWFVVLDDGLVSLDKGFGTRLYSLEEAQQTSYHRVEPGEQLIITGE